MGLRQKKVKEINSSYVQKQEKQIHQEARKRRGMMRRLTVLGVIAFIMLAFAGYTIYSQVNELSKKKSEKQLLTEQLVELEGQEQQLLIDINNYNDPDYIGEVARRDYYLSKPGETIFKLPVSSSD